MIHFPRLLDGPPRTDVVKWKVIYANVNCENYSRIFRRYWHYNQGWPMRMSVTSFNQSTMEISIAWFKVFYEVNLIQLIRLRSFFSSTTRRIERVIFRNKEIRAELKESRDKRRIFRRTSKNIWERSRGKVGVANLSLEWLIARCYRWTITYTMTRNMRLEQRFARYYTHPVPGPGVYYRPSCHSGRNTKETLLALAMQTIFKSAFKRTRRVTRGWEGERERYEIRDLISSFLLFIKIPREACFPKKIAIERSRAHMPISNLILL